jgi:HAD superfamily hydrolase (TIGR01549 family)
MNNKPYLLFDAGGTLVFPDQVFLGKTAHKYGIALNDKELFKGYYKLIYELDRQARQQGFFSQRPWPNGYAYSLLRTLGIQENKARVIGEIVNERHKFQSLWTYTFAWVYWTLKLLKNLGYRMSVISNSDGNIKRVFRDLALDCYFDEVFDSHALGVEKPDAAIFEIALNKLMISPADAVYIGDVYEVDIKGANLAGLGAIHLDPLSLYRDFPGVRLKNVSLLKQWLSEEYPKLSASDLFPYQQNRNQKFLTEQQRTSPKAIDQISAYNKSRESYVTLPL